MRCLDKIAPIGYGDLNGETFPDYRQRVKSLLPNVPDCVLEQLFHRHWRDLRLDWAWLGLTKLSFYKEEWRTDRIIVNIKSLWEEKLSAWSEQFCTDQIFRDLWLGRYMLDNGTWPCPIIVIVNDFQLTRPDGLRLKEPYNLMEGYHRLAYMRAMVQEGSPIIRAKHEIWFVKIDPNAVSHEWE